MFLQKTPFLPCNLSTGSLWECVREKRLAGSAADVLLAIIAVKDGFRPTTLWKQRTSWLYSTSG